MRSLREWFIWCGLLIAWAVGGCVPLDRQLEYLGKADLNHYKEVSQQVDFPHDDEPSTADNAAATSEPRSLQNRKKDKVRDISLIEVLHTALANNRIIRSNGQFLSSGNSLLANANGTPSVYDPSIQETGVLFGGRGVEAALADFDTNFATSMLWGRNENVQNNAFFGIGLSPGSTLQQETAAFRSSMTKRFADGGTFLVGHDWDYLGTNSPGQLFPTVYTGNVRAEYRRPLWAASGVEYTRTAGTSGSNFGAITGVSQGVVIARINNDITITNFQLAVRNLVKDAEDLYWDLYLAYRLYDSAVVTRNSSFRTWTEAKAKLDIGGVRGFDRASEPQARAQYFLSRAAAEEQLTNIYTTETRLRRLLGMPVNDGTILRPSDEPLTGELIPDWSISLPEALMQRAELRRQKWNIKSLKLQLQAARSLVHPRLDFVSSYRVNAFGDHLLRQNDRDRFGTRQGLNSAYESITQGNQTGWTLGFQFSMPLGFRSAQAQVRNYELRLAKARDVLAAQELEISHELAVAFQQLALNFANVKSNYERRRAEDERLRIYRSREGTLATTDIVLRAERDQFQAAADYYRNLVDYNKSIANLHYRKGTLLEYNNISIAEDEWTPTAYRDALRRARARSHALDNRLLHTEPYEFVAPPGERQQVIVPATTVRDDDEHLPRESTTAPSITPPAPAIAPKIGETPEKSE